MRCNASDALIIIIIIIINYYHRYYHYCCCYCRIYFFAEELDDLPLDESFSSNLLSTRNMELGNSFKSLELDTDSSRGSRESLDSLASSNIDDQSVDKVSVITPREGGRVWLLINSMGQTWYDSRLSCDE